MQVQNELHNKQCKKAIQGNFKISLHQTLIKTLLNKGQRIQDFDDLKLVSDKLKTLKNIYEKTKDNSIRIIQGQLHQTRLSLFESKTTVQKMRVIF